MGSISYRRLFSAYIFLETVCLKEKVMKHAIYPSYGGFCIKYGKNKSESQRGTVMPTQ